MEIKIVKGSVVEANADAILNAANKNLYPGGGVCGAIFNAAGYNELLNECLSIGGCPTGKAVITKGYKLNAKYIIHAVGPIYSGSPSDKEMLKSTYKSILELAEEYKLETIALVPVSVGIYGYPLLDAANIIVDVLLNHMPKSIKTCYIYCYLDKEYEVFQNVYNLKK